MTRQKELIPLRPGDLLRYEREQKGLTLERAADHSRIKPAVLAAIESGETQDIPSVYLRGYIRNYARFLGVDPEDLEGHMDHVEGAEPDVRTVFSVNSTRGQTEKWLKVSSYLVASALIATLAWQFTHQAVRFSQGETSLAAAISDQSGSNGNSQDAGRTDGAVANRHLNASIASVEALQRSNISGSSAAEEAWAAVGESVETATSDSGLHRLTVNTSADTWVEILDAGGQHLEMDLIRAGVNREYKGQGPFQLMIGRASAVQLTMDGEAVDLGPYTRGNVARMTLGDELKAAATAPATENRQ